MSFPQSVYFELFIPGSAGTIDELSLTLQIDGQVAQNIDFASGNSIDRRGDDRYVSYTLTFAESSAPKLFDVIHYSWQGRVGGEDISYSGEELYADRNVDWTTASSEDGRIKLVSDRRVVLASEIFSRYDATLGLMQEKTQRTPDLELAFYLNDDLPACPVNADGEPIIEAVANYVLVTIPCDTELLDSVLAASDYQFIQSERNANIESDLIGPLIDAYYLPLWEGVRVPDWFRYGLQTFFLPRGDAGNLAIARQVVRSGGTFRLSDMATIPLTTSLQTDWQAQAHGMVLYLASRHGVNEFFEFARSIGPYQTFEEAYEAIIGDDYEALIPDWEIWLFSDAADMAFGYTPYLETTPTIPPTPTVTPSYVVPTATVTPTSTPFMTDTPRPTRTPVPPTATITPLPAEGFVVRATATSTPIPEPPDGTIEIPGIGALSDIQIIVLAVGGLIALAFVLIAIFSRGPRDNR
ncbi:MAG: hypothetical protein CL607_12755 [Anaerolineaceae bacterium]|nr:hypothetical protein [Anaerolineaceae bacterium]